MQEIVASRDFLTASSEATSVPTTGCPIIFAKQAQTIPVQRGFPGIRSCAKPRFRPLAQAHRPLIVISGPSFCGCLAGFRKAAGPAASAVAPPSGRGWGGVEKQRLAADSAHLPDEKRAREVPFSWRWAGSNRRPNKAPDGFLHAYPSFICRRPAAGGRAIGPLASETWGAVEASAPASFLDDTPYTGGGRLESPAGYSSLRTWSARLS